MSTPQLTNSKRSYGKIVSDIMEKLQTCKASTLNGDVFLTSNLKNLMESKTPVMDLRTFVTGAEKIAGDDVSLRELVDFIRKKCTNGDLNYLINMVKEEHYDALLRSGVPNPEDTIENIKSYFDAKPSIIEEGVHNGIFDNLKSKLLNDIKVSLNVKMNESKTVETGSLVKYIPFGVRMEDIKNNRLLFITESAILALDRKTNSFSVLDESTIPQLPSEYEAVRKSMNLLLYNPIENSFNLSESWDFTGKIDANGSVFIQNKIVTDELKPKLKSLFLESIQAYKAKSIGISSVNFESLYAEADAFINMMENHANLIQLDTLTKVKNSRTGKEVYFNSNLSKPSTIFPEMKHNSFAEMCESLNMFIEGNVKTLFASQLDNEKQYTTLRNNKIKEINESIDMLNTGIGKTKSLQSIAQRGSEAYAKVEKTLKDLDESLTTSLQELSYWQNDYNPYWK